ncbi:MAG TPA: hypothetical protein IAD32_02025 [Candidatus Scatavimonas merdigallinarum]|uniref:Portal protein n=1 Tax=Candidatus Scatavimonas merdigallinarum TaxID=2840914 RepID=A0A9D1CTU0_9FIRM|nr:hypothetical protein [Candidatus Scatavimonas merdigallinarum]HIR02547.1 hypothetical protein [Candidatus Scatovicinus merdipullorum]
MKNNKAPLLQPTATDKAENMPVVGRERLLKFNEKLMEYQKGKENLDNRIIDNENWYKMRHWEQIRQKVQPKSKERITPTSGWLLNNIINKHADMRDSYPEPNVLPRAEDDREDAEILTEIIPVILEQNHYERIYSAAAYDKIKNGTSVKGVFWNPGKLGGLGDIEIKRCELLNLFWEPGIEDIQDSPFLFYVTLANNDTLKAVYPQLQDKLGGNSFMLNTYAHDDSIDTSQKSCVIDCYYKVHTKGKTILHYCKYVNDTVLFATENEAAYKTRGFYDHGRYPFVFDVLFPEKDTPVGFGYIDTTKDCQIYIDKLNQIILENAAMRGKPRFFVPNQSSVNIEDFADWNKTFIPVQSTSTENIKPVEVQPIDGNVFSAYQMKVEELKETSGNRDFSQGGTTSGVTAASAIAALQEAGSKLSRDLNKGSFNAFEEECCLIIELIRQFYTEARSFRITGKEKEIRFVSYDNSRIHPNTTETAFGVETAQRVPIFDIKVNAQKKSPFNRVAQNEDAKAMLSMGFFNPQLADQALTALEMMEFEGKEAIRQKIAQNGTMYQQLQQMQQQMNRLLSIVGTMQGAQPPKVEGEILQGQGQAGDGYNRQAIATNSLGEDLSGNTQEDKARRRASEVSNPDDTNTST